MVIMILREETFAKEIFAEFIFGIYDLIRKKLLRKHKTNSTSHKKTRENTQKLDLICKNLFQKVQNF